MRYKIIISSWILILLFIVGIFLTNCQESRISVYHQFVSTKKFQKLSRDSQIVTCAKCHQKEFENELKGPHANAYKRLLVHKEFVNGKNYHCDFYTKRVNSKILDCAGCHSSQNMLETKLKGYPNNLDSMVEQIRKSPLLKVKSKEALNSGVDCFTCHFNGNDFKIIKRIDSSAFQPIQDLHTVAKNNLSCYPCHFDILKRFENGIALQQTGSFQCVNCHVEKNEQKILTHNYFWKGEYLENVNPRTDSVLNDFNGIFSKRKNTVYVFWKNNNIPHDLPIATELLIEIKVKSKKQVTLANQTFRFNRKAEYDKEMFKELGNKYLDGVIGLDIPLADKMKFEIPIKDKEMPMFIEITYFHKAQFWISDTFKRKVTSKVISVD